MQRVSNTIRGRIAVRERSSLYLEVTKPRITMMVLVTVALGFFLAAPQAAASLALIHALIGTALACSGSGALNQYLEREVDGRMNRTRFRPLPANKVSPHAVLAFGSILAISGVAYLAATVGSLAAALNAITVVIYLFVYTPMKRVSTASTLVGAVPGALPPVIGWASATGSLEPGAWVLFAILFLWQIPHFLAISLLYREDYATADFPMLAIVDTDGRITGSQMMIYSLTLLPVSLLLVALDLAGMFYFCSALILGLMYFAVSIVAARNNSRVNARRVLLCSVTYLPLLFASIVVEQLLS